LILVILIFAAAGTVFSFSTKAKSPVVLSLEPHLASATPASDVFLVDNASGPNGNMDLGLQRLVDLMETYGTYFFKTDDHPSGLIAKSDVVIIKVNCQWGQRGGTNTDLLKSLIKKIVSHSDGFVGEIVVADNGQGRGSLDWAESNAYDHSQSAQDVVNIFSSSYNVSTFLWDTIISTRVYEYDSGDYNNGYIVNSTADPNTGLYVSYPKFKTAFGTYISFKNGVWDPSTSTYNSTRLKIINMPVLKSHSGYGVTACIKHYMGVQSQYFSNGHARIPQGGMGTEMVQTRFPIINILDSIWVNAIPGNGPSTSYGDASYTNIISASVDPVALDYIGSKYILMPAAAAKGYTNLRSINPDEPNQNFHNYLVNSRDQLRLAGYQVTMNESEINVITYRASITHPPTTNVYEVKLDVNTTFNQGNKLKIGFYSYAGEFQAESTVWNGTTPAIVELSTQIEHPLGLPVEIAALVLTYENGTTISTVTTFTMCRCHLTERLGKLDGDWLYTSPSERPGIFLEIVDIDMQWPYASA